jgi:hypothetical protein
VQIPYNMNQFADVMASPTETRVRRPVMIFLNIVKANVRSMHLKAHGAIGIMPLGQAWSDLANTALELD